MTAPKKRYPPNNVKAKRKPCIDCADEGIETKRKAPHPGPRCATHHRVKRSKRRDMSWETRILVTYGITADEYWAIYEWQDGRCYICQRAIDYLMNPPAVDVIGDRIASIENLTSNGGR